MVPISPRECKFNICNLFIGVLEKRTGEQKKEQKKGDKKARKKGTGNDPITGKRQK